MRNFEDLVCDVCDQPFEYQHTLEEHFKIHTGEVDEWPPQPTFRKVNKNKFKCPFCNKRYKLERQCRAHQRMKHDKTSITCEVCGKGFNKTNSFEKHGDIHARDMRKLSRTELELRYMECPVCKKTITRKHEQAHTKTHLNDFDTNVSRDDDEVVLVIDSSDEGESNEEANSESPEQAPEDVYADENVIILTSDDEE